jgi:hypothetical protein
MNFICKFVKSQFQKEKLQYKKMYGMVKSYMSVEECNTWDGISGNSNNYFINGVFRDLKDGEKHGFTVLRLGYET